MTSLANNAEGGTNGTTATTGNTGGSSGTAFDTCQLGTATTNAFDSGVAMHGLSYKLVTAGTSAQAYERWSTAFTTAFGGSLATVWGRFYINVQALPSATRNLVGLHDSGVSADRATFAMLTGGTIRLRNAAAGTVATFVTACSTNTWYRVEFKIDGSASGTYEIRLYLGDSSTLLETALSGSAINFGGTIGAITYGYFSNVANAPQINFDDVEVNNVTFPGPASTTLAGAVALTTASGLTVAGIENAVSAAGLTAASGLTAAGLQTTNAGAGLAAVSELTASAGATAVSAVGLTAASGLTAGAVSTSVAAAGMSAATGLGADGAVSTGAAAVLSAVSGLSAGAVVSTPGAAALTAESALTAAGTPGRVAALVLGSETSLGVTGATGQAAAASLDANSSLTPDGVRAAPGAVALSALSALVATASGATVAPARRISSYSTGPSITTAGAGARLVASGNDP